MRRQLWLVLLPLIAGLLWTGAAPGRAAVTTTIYDSAVAKQNPGLA